MFRTVSKTRVTTAKKRITTMIFSDQKPSETIASRKRRRGRTDRKHYENIITRDVFFENETTISKYSNENFGRSSSSDTKSHWNQTTIIICCYTVNAVNQICQNTFKIKNYIIYIHIRIHTYPICNNV